MSSAPLTAAIVRTVAYFDLFDYPLTAHELWRWLLLPGHPACALAAVIEALASPEVTRQVASRDGMYFLTGRQANIEQRFLRYQLAEHKVAIAKRAARAMRWLPFVELVAVCNKLGYANTPAEGDIDFFVVVRRNRLWTARLLVTMLVSLLGIRITREKVADRVCLSFFATAAAQDFSAIALRPDDPYLRYWVATLMPIYDRRTRRSSPAFSHYQKLLDANAALLADLPNFFPALSTPRRAVSDTLANRLVNRLAEVFLSGRPGDWLERVLRAVQLWRRRVHDRRGEQRTDAGVVMSDDMLKFHEHDRREYYRSAWEANVPHTV